MISSPAICIVSFQVKLSTQQPLFICFSISGFYEKKSTGIFSIMVQKEIMNLLFNSSSWTLQNINGKSLPSTGPLQFLSGCLGVGSTHDKITILCIPQDAETPLLHPKWLPIVFLSNCPKISHYRLLLQFL